MISEQIKNLKPKVQTVIDLIVKKDWVNANISLHDVSNEVEDLFDTAVLDEHIIELSRYQVLIQHLLQKINNDRV